MKKTLVAYFSASGNTAAVAEAIAKAVGGDLFEIAPKVKYTAADLNWMDKKARSTVEMKDRNSRPEMAGSVSGMESYDTVFVGFPVWWYTAPTIINTFIDAHDFSGKTIIPFATSGSSGIEACTRDLRSAYPQYHFEDGRLVNTRQSAKDWAESLKEGRIGTGKEG